MDFFESLNAAQQRAVFSPNEPILVLAGPGTGKTRTLVGRILYFVRHSHISPHRILAVTFTNKAKEEMKNRLRALLGDAASDLKIGTFHRFCMTVLREHYDKADLPKEFSIADEATQLLALSRASRIQDEKSLNTVLNAISSYRLNKANLNPNFQAIALKWLAPYCKELRKNKLIDFDQILLFTQDLFTQYPELVATYRQMFDAILVDEFQDTDPIQYEIIRSLAQAHRNIFAVADDDQSIFAWRGAHIENIDRYVQDFDCQENVVVLNENYRSAQCIIDVATQLINCGPRFREKQIYGVALDVENLVAEPQFCSFPDDETETEFIKAQISTLTQSDHPLRYADIAILYPTHVIGDHLEATLLSADIPCQLIKRRGVFDQPDIRKVILLLKLLQNPGDDVALEQFFELELRDDLVFQQIRSLKARNRSFKQTLMYAAYFQREEIAGISKGKLIKIMQTCFGMISNLISYLEEKPQADLPELINLICNLMTPVNTVTIHSRVHHLRDPFDIPGIKEVAVNIIDTVAAGNKVYIYGENLDIAHICQYLLNNVLDQKKNVANVPRTPESTWHIEANDLIICLDNLSANTLTTSSPQINDSQIVLITSPVSKQNENLTPHTLPLTIHSPLSPVVTIFKLLQAITAAKTPRIFRNYTVIDLETTSGDTRTTGIVEIGAVKVRDGKIVGEFGTLVNPEQPITEGARRVHGISDEDVRAEKTFAELLPEFMAFIGDDLLVAHNGFHFDFPILMRFYKQATGQTLPNRRFDTLPLARRLFPGQPASVDSLMQRFGIQDKGGRHRALDDTIYLASIFERLQTVERSLNRRSEHEELLELVAFGIYLDLLSNPAVSEVLPENSEERLCFQLGVKKLLSRFSELPEQFQSLYAQHQAGIRRVYEELPSEEIHPDTAPARLFSGREAAIARLKDLARSFSRQEHYPDLAANEEPYTIRDAIQHFLDHATLYNPQDDIRDVNAVNLLTIHSAKGLEFPVVFVSGVEKGNLPSFYSVREESELGEKKLNEQRRLFYVAMTRAKHKLFVTYVNKRGEYSKKRSQFLVELGIEAEEALDA